MCTQRGGVVFSIPSAIGAPGQLAQPCLQGLLKDKKVAMDLTLGEQDVYQIYWLLILLWVAYNLPIAMFQRNDIEYYSINFSFCSMST